jgi:holliday junction DNA helicase RuvA
MIALISGRLLEKTLASVVVSAGGVGYQVAVPLSTFEKLPEVGAEVQLYTHLHVREDALLLFGFHSRPERLAFEKLISVSGIGPRIALSILSSLPVERLVSAIEGSQISWFNKIPGVGKKTAERLIFELKGKLGGIAPFAVTSIPVSAGGEEAVSALVSLGYSRVQAESAMAKVLEETGEGLNTAELIRRALSRI